VFVVGCLGDWRAAAEVLAIREGLQRDSAKSGTAREEIAGTLAARSGECRNNPEQLVVGTLGRAIAKSRTELDNHGASLPVFQPVPYDLFQITAPAIGALCARDYKGVSSQYVEEGKVIVTPYRKSKRAQSATDDESWVQAETSNTVNAFDTGERDTHAVATAMTVRRLTPRECERLQGFPDDWTLVPHRGKPAADGPRYKALGNSMACNCMAWIGERIAQYEQEDK